MSRMHLDREKHRGDPSGLLRFTVLQTSDRLTANSFRILRGDFMLVSCNVATETEGERAPMFYYISYHNTDTQS